MQWVGVARIDDYAHTKLRLRRLQGYRSRLWRSKVNGISELTAKVIAFLRSSRPWSEDKSTTTHTVTGLVTNSPAVVGGAEWVWHGAGQECLTFTGDIVRHIPDHNC